MVDYLSEKWPTRDDELYKRDYKTVLYKVITHREQYKCLQHGIRNCLLNISSVFVFLYDTENIVMHISWG